MREVKPTQKPVPSSDAKDLLFNATKIDEVVNSSELTYVDRLGNKRMTVAGLESASGDASLAIEAANSALDSANKANASLNEVKEEAANIEDNAAQIASSAAQQVIDGVDAAVSEASMYAKQAENARDSVAQLGLIFSTATEGQNSPLVSVGAYYWVISPLDSESLELWRKGSSSPLKTGKSTVSANITHGLNQAQSAFFYLDSSNNLLPPPVVEQAGSGAEFNLYIRFNRDIRIRALNGVLAENWSKIKLDINDPSLFVKSPQGVDDCLKLNDQALVYNKTLAKFQVVSFLDLDSTKQYIIAISAYGQLVGGLFFDWWLNRCNLSIDNAVSTKFYMSNGNKASSIPIVEQARESDPYDLYIKLREDIRIQTNERLILASWEKIKEDINDAALFVKSPSGIDDCLKLRDKSLVYDNASRKFQVIDRLKVNTLNHILLAYAVYGQLTAGLIFDWWLTKSKSASSVSTATSGASGTPKVNLIAHGGMSGLSVFAPFDTLPAYRLAGEYGYFGAETDLVETKDGYWVLCHDEILDNYTNGTGNISDYTLAELKQLDASKMSWNYGWKDVPLPTLDEFLEVCVQYGMRPFLEIKPTIVSDDGLKSIIGAIQRHMSIFDVTIMSFNVSILRRLRVINEQVSMALLTFAVNEGHIVEAQALGRCMLNVRSDSNPELVRNAVIAGLDVGVWSVSQTEVNAVKFKGVKYLTVDAAIDTNFNRGRIVDIVKNKDDYSNLEMTGTTNVIDGALTVTSGSAWVDLQAEKGTAITVSLEAKSAGSVTLDIIELGELDSTVSVSSSVGIVSQTYIPVFSSAVAIHREVKKLRIKINVDAGEVTLRGLKVKVYEI